MLWAFALLNALVAAVTWRHATRDLPDSATEMSGVGALQLGGVLWSLLGNLDVVIVGLLLGAAPPGMYSVSLRVAEFSAQFVVAISLFFLPEATRLALTGAREALVALYRTACRWSAFTTLLVAGIGFISAPEIARIVFPDEQETTTTLLRILFAGYGGAGRAGGELRDAQPRSAPTDAHLALVAGGAAPARSRHARPDRRVGAHRAPRWQRSWPTCCSTSGGPGARWPSWAHRPSTRATRAPCWPARRAGWPPERQMPCWASAGAGAVLTVAVAGLAGLVAGGLGLLVPGALSPGERELAARAAPPARARR